MITTHWGHSLTACDVPRLLRAHCIDWLTWNDPNGVYTDADCRREGLPRLTRAQARALILEHLEKV